MFETLWLLKFQQRVGVRSRSLLSTCSQTFSMVMAQGLHRGLPQCHKPLCVTKLVNRWDSSMTNICQYADVASSPLIYFAAVTRSNTSSKKSRVESGLNYVAIVTTHTYGVTWCGPVLIRRPMDDWSDWWNDQSSRYVVVSLLVSHHFLILKNKKIIM